MSRAFPKAWKAARGEACRQSVIMPMINCGSAPTIPVNA